VDSITNTAGVRREPIGGISGRHTMFIRRELIFRASEGIR
jgi:hypothetical protein